MTVSTAYSPLTYNGNGATTAFSVTWPFFTGSLVVTAIDADGVETVKTLATHYTVSGGTDATGLPATGTVTMLSAPASGTTLRIERSTALTQGSTWGENDNFPQKTIEAALDKLTLQSQERAYGASGLAMQLVTSGEDPDYWDASSHKISNVVDPVDDQDAVTKAYGDTHYGGAALDSAAASAVAAAASASSAATSESNAATSASGAATSASSAATSASNASTSATNASNSASAAATSAIAAAAASGFTFTFSSTTAMADPGSGTVRLNNATLASVTAIAIDDLSADTGTPDVSAWVLTFDDSTNTSVKGTLRLRKQSAPQNFVDYRVTGLTDNSGWTELAVTYSTHAGSFANADVLIASFFAAGDKGADGVGAGDVTAASTFGTDNRIIRSDGTSKGVQASAITIDDSGNVSGMGTLASGAITSTGEVKGTTLAFNDSNASHKLALTTSSDLTANRTLTLIPGDADRSLTIGANSSISGTAYVVSGTDVPVTDGGTGASDASTARVNLEVPVRNLIINGDGAINQRAAGSGIADDTYAWDRHYVLTQTSTIAVSTVTDAADGVPYLFRMTQSQASAQRMGGATILESIDAKRLRGQTVTLSGKVRLSSAATVRWAILEWTGTADSPTSDVVNSWTNTTYTAGQFFISTTTTVAGTGSLALSANTLTDFSLSASISSSCNNIVLMIWTDGTVAQNVTLDWRWKLERGSAATVWTPWPLRAEEDLCMRYYWRTDSALNNTVVFGSGYAASTIAASAYMKLPVRMRASPTVGYSGALSFTQGNAFNNISSLGTSSFNGDGGKVSVAGTGFTSAAAGLLQANTSTSVILTFDAEL